MDDEWLQMGDAQRYMRSQYNITWSRPFIVKLVREGSLKAIQPGGPRGWWFISRTSIDALLKPS